MQFWSWFMLIYHSLMPFPSLLIFFLPYLIILLLMLLNDLWVYMLCVFFTIITDLIKPLSLLLAVSFRIHIDNFLVERRLLNFFFFYSHILGISLLSQQFLFFSSFVLLFLLPQNLWFLGFKLLLFLLFNFCLFFIESFLLFLPLLL